MNDEFLTRFRRPPRKAFAAALYQRISQPMNTDVRPGWLRRPALALAAAILLAITLAAIPPLNAFARDVLRQIGVISFTDAERVAPHPADAPRGLPDPTPTPIPLNRPQTLTTLDEISAEAGFRPLVPGYLPAGYALADLLAMEYLDDAQQPQGRGTSLIYWQTGDRDRYLDIQQALFTGDEPHEFPVGDNPITDVTVRGQPGVWLEQARLDPRAGHTANILLWEEAGYIHSLFSASLALAEMLTIAESLVP
jgi:hypothetical protein